MAGDMQQKQAPLGALWLPALVWSYGALGLASLALYQIATPPPLLSPDLWETVWAPATNSMHPHAQTVWGAVILIVYALLCLYLRECGVLSEVHRLGEFKPVHFPIIAGAVGGLYILDHYLLLLGIRVTGNVDFTLYNYGYEIPVTFENLFGELFSSVIAAPLFEELVFRGFLLGVLLARGWLPVQAVLASSLLFALTHTQYTAYGQLLIFLSGCVFAVLRLQTGGIRVPILAHALLNLIITLAELQTGSGKSLIDSI